MELNKEPKQKKRNEIDPKYQWKLEHIFETVDDWRSAVSRCAEETEALAGYKGKLNDPQTLLEFLEKTTITERDLGAVYVYASMKSHEDANISENKALADIAQSTYIKYGAATSFMVPEILEIGKATVEGYIQNTPGLQAYQHILKDILRKKAHTLSAEIEEILANSHEIGNAPDNIFETFDSADIKFDNVQDGEGNTVALTHGKYGQLMQSKNRAVRKEAYESYYKGYMGLKNTLATIHSSSVKKDVFYARTRKYGSSLEESLSENNIPIAVYSQLVSTVEKFLPALHRYTALRKKVLKVDTLEMYDRMAPLVEEVDAKMDYESAKKKLIEGLAPLGEDYIAEMTKGMEAGWIDVYENEGKQAGAYAWGTPKAHPYVLLNYTDTLYDMFTLAHEMGHAMHSFYTWQTQPPQYAGYPTFLAEVASTVNETILLEHMLKEAKSQGNDKLYAYLLDEYIGQFHGTVFRQTMFAEFELETHAMVERGEPLTLDNMNALFRKLNAKYFGPEMNLGELSDFGWAMIPHFYRAFYVYQYATGYAAAIAFNQRIQSGDPEKVAAYLNFLKAGNHQYPIDILKDAGVDMSTSAPIASALTVFEDLVGQLEAAIG